MLLSCVEAGGYLPCSETGAGGPAPRSAASLAATLHGQSAQQGLPDLHLLLPAARCLVTTVPVTRQEIRHFAETVPWMLEERLLEPVEQVHVAHGAVAEGSVPVAAVNAAWLRQRIEELRAAGLQPVSACSEIFLLPWQPGQWTLFLPAFAAVAATDGASPRVADPAPVTGVASPPSASPASAEPVLLRHGAHEGFACARSNLPTALQLLLNERGEAPQTVLVISEAAAPADTALFPSLLQSRLVQRQQSRAGLAAAFVPPACNLLQGRYAAALPWARWWQQWRVAAILLVGLLVSDLALVSYDTLRLERAADANEAAILDLYRSVQPDGVVVDPRLQLEQALAAAGAAGHEGFLAMLGRMAPALQATPAARVQTLEYDASSGTLQVQLLTPDYAAAEGLRTQLQQLGLQAELLGSSRDGSGSRTRLRVGAGA